MGGCIFFATAVQSKLNTDIRQNLVISPVVFYVYVASFVLKIVTWQEINCQEQKFRPPLLYPAILLQSASTTR